MYIYMYIYIYTYIDGYHLHRGDERFPTVWVRLFNHSVEIPSQVSRSKRQVGPCKAFKALPKTQGTSTLLSLCNGNGWAPHRIHEIPSLAMKKVFSWKMAMDQYLLPFLGG